MKLLTLDKLCPQGITGTLAQNITKNWLIGLRETNPAILDMFADRDKLPYRDLLPWSGEFAGKYITGAYYTYLLTKDEALRSYIEAFIDELLTYQDEDGYLGVFSKACHLTGCFSQTPEQELTEYKGNWDSWAHYHLMFGLYKWYCLNKNPKYMQAIEQIAALYAKTFFNPQTGSKRLVDMESSEMNLAPYHIFAILAAETGKTEYLHLAKEIEKDIADERAGNYLYYAQNGLDYYQCPKPRWESMHIIMGIAEMYRATGEKQYLDYAMQIFKSILRTDIHNTGAFSTNEQAVGSPFREGAIETCCVIAYNALAVTLYSLTGDTDILDFLELSHYNAVLGYYNPTGRWSTYDTPMEGAKCANYHSINFQCRPGSPDLNCCSVNAPRGAAEIAEWMLCEQDDIIYINNYEPLLAETPGFRLEISSCYPAPGVITLRLHTDTPRKVALRIPRWSKTTTLLVDGEPVTVNGNGYVFLPEHIYNGESITLQLDFSVHYLDGQEQFAGKKSIYYGPLLFGCDTALTQMHPITELPALSEKELSAATPKFNQNGNITLPLSNGITLCDFRMLGYTGAQYRTFFETKP